MATPITAALTLDASNYRKELKRASDDTKKFSKDSQQSTKEVGAAFDRLKGAIAAVGFTALIAKVQAFGNAVDGMARATGVGVSTILGMQQSFAAAGGTADRARDAISDLTKNLGEAQLGSKELTAAFARVNVSMTDLMTLSKQDILKKTIQGLNDIPDSAQRTAIGFKLMGESIKGVDLAKLNADLEKNIQINSQYSGAVSTAGQAGGNLAVHLDKLTLALAKVTEPLNKIIATMDISVDTMVSVLKIVGQLIAVYLAFGKGLPAITKGMDLLAIALKTNNGVMGLARKEIGLIVGNFESFGKGMLRSIGIMDSAKSSLFSFTAGIAGAGRGLLRLAGWAGIAITALDLLNLAFKQFTGKDLSQHFDDAAVGLEKWVTERFPKLAAAINKAGEALGTGGSAIEMQKQAQYNQQELDRLAKKSGRT